MTELSDYKRLVEAPMVEEFRRRIAAAEARALSAEAALSEVRGALDDAEVALRSLIAKYSYHDDGEPKDWSEWVFAREAQAAALAALTKADQIIGVQGEKDHE